MKQGIIQSPPCVKSFLIKLKRAVKAVSRGNGQREKLKCLPSGTKKKAAATQAEFYINLFSILDPQIHKQKNKKRLKKNKQKDIGKVIAHSGYIAKPRNS